MMFLLNGRTVMRGHAVLAVKSLPFAYYSATK